MKRIKAASANVRIGPIRNRKVYNKLRSLKQGETVVIDKKEWFGNDLVHTLHNLPSLRKKFSCTYVKNKGFWIVNRL